MATDSYDALPSVQFNINDRLLEPFAVRQLMKHLAGYGTCH
jgi:hypothetical protein